MKRIYAVLLSLTLLLCSCYQSQAERQIYIMDTVINMSVYGDSNEDALNAVEDMLNEVDEMCSPTDPDSQVNQINSSEKEGVEISKELESILVRSQEIHSETDGAFDITLGRIIDLWDIGGEKHRVPSEEEIQEALSVCGAHRLSVGDEYAKAEEGTVINLGGVAKGYAAECAMNIFKEKNVPGALVSIGGNICVWGDKSDGTPWKIGVRDPDGTSSEYIAILEAKDTVIAVSGDYERFFEAGGKRYHHIIDAATGAPAESDIRSVSVICDDGLRADALSTALYVMGKDRALELWRSSDDFECIIVDDDMTVTATDGVLDKLCITDGRYSLETESR